MCQRTIAFRRNLIKNGDSFEEKRYFLKNYGTTLLIQIFPYRTMRARKWGHGKSIRHTEKWEGIIMSIGLMSQRYFILKNWEDIILSMGLMGQRDFIPKKKKRRHYIEYWINEPVTSRHAIQQGMKSYWFNITHMISKTPPPPSIVRHHWTTLVFGWLNPSNSVQSKTSRPVGGEFDKCLPTNGEALATKRVGCRCMQTLHLSWIWLQWIQRGEMGRNIAQRRRKNILQNTWKTNSLIVSISNSGHPIKKAPDSFWTLSLPILDHRLLALIR